MKMAKECSYGPKSLVDKERKRIIRKERDLTLTVIGT